MSHRGLLNIVLLVAVAGLGLFAYYEPGRETSQEQPRLTKIAPSSINHIQLHRKNMADVSLNKEQLTWRIDYQGKQLPANTWRIEALLDLLDAQSHSHFTANPDQLDKYGLADPRARVQFNNQEILIGDNEPIKRWRYVMVNQQVHTITDVFYQHLFADKNNYLSLSLLPNQIELKRITLPNVSLTESDTGWVADPTQSLSAEQLNTFVDEWRFAQAMEITASEQQEGELITLEYVDGKQVNFIHHDSQLIRTDLKLAYHFTDETLQRLLSPKPIATN